MQLQSYFEFSIKQKKKYLQKKYILLILSPFERDETMILPLKLH